jgi:hypothetical protein
LRFAVVVAALLLPAGAARAQTDQDDLAHAQEMARELIGGPVFAPEGAQVGEVADVALDAEGNIDTVRMRSGAVLGLGERVLELPSGTFIALRGAIVLQVPAEALQSLPQSEGEK